MRDLNDLFFKHWPLNNEEKGHCSNAKFPYCFSNHLFKASLSCEATSHFFCLWKFRTYCQFSHRTVNRMQDISVAFPLLQNIRMFSRAGTPHVKAIIQDIFNSRMTTWGSHAFFFPHFNFFTCSFKDKGTCKEHGSIEQTTICKMGGRGPFLPRTWLSRKVQHSKGIISTFCPWNQTWKSACIYSTAAGLEVVNP